MIDVLALTEALVRAPSVTPEDAGCQQLLAAELERLGFTTTFFNAGGVSNLWATRGSHGPHLVLAGHTDVVPPGPLDAWHSDPFAPEIRDGYLYGRGTADMKASLAAMLRATEAALEKPLAGTLSFLITSDEEGPATCGTRHAIEQLVAHGVRPDFCVVGEPSSSERLGDVVRCGRRGSLNGRLRVIGVQGHVAYPDQAHNPVHAALGALAALSERAWDTGNDYYPPTGFQISNVTAGTGATNVIPGTLDVVFNFRFNTEQTAAGLADAVAGTLASHGLDYELEWELSGEPFLTETGALTRAVSDAIEAETGHATELSTSGGTSDGRFIAPWTGHPPRLDSAEAAPMQVEVVELGPCNATIHKVNECVRVADLEPLSRIYQRVIEALVT